MGSLLFGEFQGAWTQISVGILGENTPMAALLHWHDPLKERPQSGAKGGEISVSKTFTPEMIISSTLHMAWVGWFVLNLFSTNSLNWGVSEFFGASHPHPWQNI